jgi:hypothetical protein
MGCLVAGQVVREGRCVLFGSFALRRTLRKENAPRHERFLSSHAGLLRNVGRCDLSSFDIAESSVLHSQYELGKSACEGEH